MSNLTIDNNHIYRYNGTVVPGVSQILQKAGIVDLSAIPADRLAAAQEFGTAVHIACELHDKGTLDEAILDPQLKPYLDGWKLFRQEHSFQPEKIEEKLYSKIYRFAGTIDRIGKCRIDDSLVIVDIKSGIVTPSIAIQLAAYELLVREHTGGKKTKRLVIFLNNTGTYKMQLYKDKIDTNIFLSALCIYNFKERNGKRNN